MKVLLTNVCDLYNKGEVALVTTVAKNFPQSELMIAPLFSFIDSALCTKLKISVWGRLKPLPKPLLLVWVTLVLLRAGAWSFLNKVCRVNMAYLLNRELRAYSRADLIVDLGGDTFSDDYGFLASCMHCYSLFLAILLGKPYFVCSQTIGPFKTPLTRFFARFILARAQMITVREGLTQKYLLNNLKLALSNRLKLVPDLAFLLEPENPIEIKKLLLRKGIRQGDVPIIIVNPSNLIWRYMFPQLSLEERYAQYTRIMARMVDDLPPEAAVVLVPHVTARKSEAGKYKNVNDTAAIFSIYQEIKNKSRVHLITEDLDPREIKGIIKAADLLIGCRMHAVIAALSSGTPTVALSYSNKTMGIIGELLGLRDIIVNVRDQNDSALINDELSSKITFIWKQRARISQQLQSESHRWRKQATVNIQLIKKLYILNTIDALRSRSTCNGCGNCVFVCPNGALTAKPAQEGFRIRLNFSSCIGCGLCLRSCPKIYSAQNVKPQNVLLGKYDQCWVGQANDDLRKNVTSGGIVTGLLVNALKEAEIDGAIVTESQGTKTVSVIACTKKEVLSSSGTKYCPVDFSATLKEISGKPGKFAFVGLPCQIAAIRKLEESNVELKQKIVLHIGLFCSHNVSANATKLLLESMGISYPDVTDLCYRARKGGVTGMSVRTKSGRERFIPSKKYWTRFFNYFFIPWACLMCHDLTSEQADISVGDAWLPEYKKAGVHHCIFITRDSRSSTLVQSAINNNVLTAKRVDAATVVKSQKMYLHIKKRQTCSPGLLALSHLALMHIGYVISIRFRMYSAVKVFLQILRVSH
ncbi:MAG: polysaccharide pyruvyl transferase family protein [Candidatus Bathyarchaeota archaeon]|nr:polysaccharide pyruvyl transferase family protein [Candidatus Bathyarchaeota archaeon]